MGGFATQKQDQSGTSSSKPLDAQMPYLSQAWSGASNALGQAQAAPKPDSFVAQFNPDQLNIFKQMIGFGSTANTGANPAMGAGVANAGANAATGALSSLGSYAPTGGVDSNIAEATKYANNPAISGMVDSAMRDSERNVFENYLPQRAQMGAATGNRDSSRQAISQGIAARGLADQRGDIDANLRGQAFDAGLSRAESGRQFDNSSALQALMASLSGGTGAMTAGTAASGDAINQQKGLFDIANSGAGGLQAADQATKDEAAAKYGFGTSSPFDALNAFYNIVGSQNWGSNQTSNVNASSTASPASVLGGLMGSFGSLMKSDRRSKTEVYRIGELLDGLPIYRFRYKDDPTRTVHVGLMAQDVEKRYPTAVKEINGVKHVDYGHATMASVAAMSTTVH